VLTKIKLIPSAELHEDVLLFPLVVFLLAAMLSILLSFFFQFLFSIPLFSKCSAWAYFCVDTGITVADPWHHVVAFAVWAENFCRWETGKTSLGKVKEWDAAYALNSSIFYWFLITENILVALVPVFWKPFTAICAVVHCKQPISISLSIW
jgi:hypothetical protein